ncbi:ABC transporter ATP-binding protein [Desulfocurvibacter africanus]|uniref:energy-coupling factor ABC transporter ATP-binding protein n=1 Tax=Desulfocurvibacter africanus TaxID=873 RepID=UPI00040BC6D9|nr:ABC transporter ATP-binding protein [Desulfocurvibacter africanus]
MIHLADIHFTYDRTKVFQGISLRLERGLTLALVGANGSGKSTLLSLLAGLYVPDTGSLSVAGYASPGQEKAIRLLSGLVVQDADLQILGATVGEDLCLGLDPEDAVGMAEARRLAASFYLEELWEEPVQVLSWGQKRKLCIAAALRRKPKLLLLDEPFSGLDYPGMREMRSVLLANKAAKLTQVISAHDIEPLADIADLWAVLEKGRLVAWGTAAEVFPLLAGHHVRPPCSWQAGLGVRPWE